MKNDFWGLIWSSFLKIQGITIGFLALLISIFFWLYSPDKNISLRFAVPIFILLIVVIFTFASAAYESFKISRHNIPKIVLGKKIGSNLLCLLEPSELFSHDTLVSFFYIEESFEELIALGKVINIQEDGKIQVTVNLILRAHEDTITKLEQNDANVIKRIKVKPNIPGSFSSGALSSGLISQNEWRQI